MARKKLKQYYNLPPNEIRLIPIQPVTITHSPTFVEADVVKTVARYINKSGKNAHEYILDARQIPAEVFKEASGTIICKIDGNICLVQWANGRLVNLGKFFKQGQFIALATADCPLPRGALKVERANSLVEMLLS